ncbi:hypothetical protein Q5424_24765 [Conexibacter sp. JD483]|uniref:hypothetical protein n=1 Tax=unclassified Conexibacter TaxID=2627773 RepID=UPI002718EA79|nr:MULTISPECIES: hypothetical protein [unclassified Conexibacter]MDO8189328.1 hypothetical protein [Conexibacter sp. CPCC 205706]MDO8201607.1 hypothetical protein [Conexibacter sp. CPCC 205762]MDR9372335.1 hypothetical protein [Conexibacter sp. JD483]
MSVVDQLAPDALISHAWRLVGDEPLGTAAHALDLRRAVSSAYYAVFHEVCHRTAGQVTGRGRYTVTIPDVVVAHLVRAIPHRAVATACRQVEALRKTRPDNRWTNERVAAWHLVHVDPPNPPSVHLCAFAIALVKSLDFRQLADYDRLAVIEYDDAANAVDAAERALVTLREDGDTPAFQGFFTLVAMAARGSMRA